MKRHSAILTNLLLSLPLATGLLCAATNASAQTSETVTIPFEFSADHQLVQAGSYEVRLLSSSFLTLYNLKTAKTQILMVRPDEGRVIETRGRLVFRRDETGSHLTQVWIVGKSSHSELAFQPKPGQAMAKNNPVATFEIALK